MSSAPSGPLESLRVLVVGDYLAAPVCGQFLSRLGASVTRIESPETGTLQRLADHGLIPPAAAAFGRVGLAVRPAADLAASLGQLLPEHDVLVTDLTRARLTELGLDPRRWQAEQPGKILVSITGYGLSGPHAERPWSELTTYHAGGEGYLLPGDPVYSMFPDRPPVRGGRFLAEYDAALAGLVGALGALVGRARTGRGDVVEISGQEVEIGLNRTTLSGCLYDGRDLGRGDRGYDYGGLLRCRDGWVSLRPTEDRQWSSFCREIGRPDLARDEHYATRAARDANGPTLTAELEAWSAQRTRAEIRQVILDSECPGGPFLDPGEVLADPALDGRDLFQPFAGGTAPLRLFTLSPGVPAGDVGPPSAPGPAAGPLAGLRVLDLTWVAAGPYATALMRFLGADVVKVESPDRPDLFRRLVRGGADDLDSSIRFSDLNQGKRSIVLDLKSEPDHAIFMELAAGSHVVVDNYRPGVRARLGIGDADLWRVNPALVCASLSGFGDTGSMTRRPGYASVFNAESGLGTMTGYADGPPTEIRDSNDLRAGMATCAAALAGLLAAWAAGRGQTADVAAREVLITLQGDAVLEASRGGTPGRSGNALGSLVPYGCYRAADGSWLAVSVRSGPEWAALTGVLGPGPLARPELADPAVRWAHRAEVDAQVSGWVARRTADEAADLLGAAGVPASVSAAASRLAADPHLNARQVFVTAHHPRLGAVTLIGSPLRYWSATAVPDVPAPLLDEHRDEILRELRGAPEPA